MENKMNTNFEKCRVVLEPITPKSNGNCVNIRSKSLTPKSDKVEPQITSPCFVKLKPLQLPSMNKSLTNTQQLASMKPCCVKLENMKESNGVTEQISDKLNGLLSSRRSTRTPLAVSNRRKSLPDTKSTVTKTKKGVTFDTFEPATPRSHIEFSMELKKVINERNILTSKTKKRVFEALDDIKTKTEEESRRYKKEKALLEIVNSEIKYVHQLEIIMNFFMKPTEEQKLLKQVDFNMLFGNINTIYNINKELLYELDKGCNNVANAFYKIAPFLKLYSVYAYEFKNSLNILQNARSLNPQFATFLENQESRPEVQNKLSALLITPIQRVPRYKLLLTNLHQLTLPTEKEFINLSDCLEKIENAAEHINKVIEDQENIQQLLEFQRCLRSGEPNIITPGRKLIKQGVLMQISEKTGHSEKIYVVLMNDIIIFTKMKRNEPKVNSLKCLSIFPISKCKVIEILDKGCLKIVCQEEELVLYHEQFCETKKWIRKIKESIDSYLNNRKTLRKESSSRRPVKRKDLHEYHVTGLSPGRPLKKRKTEVERNPLMISTKNHRLLKRKPIHTLLSADHSTNKNDLYASFPSSVPSASTSSEIAPDDNHKQAPVLSKDVYVFGQPNNNSGFKFGKFLGGVGSTIKRFLGFRNNY